MAANDPRSLDYQQMQEAMRQLQATNAQQASPQHLLVPQQLAAQASNVLGTSPAVFGANRPQAQHYLGRHRMVRSGTILNS
jgi:hypothetical protein